MPFAFSTGQHTISQKGQDTGQRYFEGGDEWGEFEITLCSIHGSDFYVFIHMNAEGGVLVCWLVCLCDMLVSPKGICCFGYLND